MKGPLKISQSRHLVMLCVMLCSTALFAASPVAPGSKSLFYEDMYGSSTGIPQFYDILSQLSRSMGDIPPEIRRMAVYQIKVDRSEFTPGMGRFLQGKIEETFLKYGRRQIVAAEELRTMRIVSTDTSFQMSNTLPNLEELWALGEKLMLDGFIEGNLTRSEAGDVLLHLKVFRHKTAEVAWSGSFVAGPNKQPSTNPFLEMGVKLGLGYWPADRFERDTLSVSGDALELDLYHYYIEATIGEPANKLRRLFLSASAGLGMITPVKYYMADTLLGELENYYTFQAGADVLAVFLPKEENDDGYWFGAYLGLRAFIPQKLIMVHHGYTSRFTRHFTLGVGVNFLPLFDKFVTGGSLFSANEYQITPQNPSYEASIQYDF